MASAGAPKILLTGATGYIGGTILTTLLASTSPNLANSNITLLLRGEARAKALKAKYGSRVNPVCYEGLDDLDATVAAASNHDLVINTTLGFHSPSAQALLRGLGQRKASTGRPVYLIHTSGTSNLADAPVSGKYKDPSGPLEFDDATFDVHGYESKRNEARPYPQRDVELGVINTGLELGVNTLVIMSGLIFGLGTGAYNRVSIQIPSYARAVLRYGRGVVIGDGKAVWDHVHVVDLADLYTLAVNDILENGGNQLPFGKKGIIFSANGRHTWLQVAQGVADAVFSEGKCAQRDVQSVTLPEATKILSLLGMTEEDMLEGSLASNSRTVASVAKGLGWKPTRGEEDFKKGFKDDLQEVLASQ